MIADDLDKLADWLERWAASSHDLGDVDAWDVVRRKALEVRAMAERARGKGGTAALERLCKEPPTVVTWSGNDTIPSDRWLSALMDVLTAHQATLEALQEKLDKEG